ncbi:single-stranded-DNA-specific exonuclease RecJ [Alicyclobacillus sp.]|uniref:single-stranded-DNA-specific exonuclease RecJ n=1 Tax=Alicyclobacillus sp. TaxID=61169 RepID=UPI0025C7291B|nr:single-stranded-DNA-specific exonuclease RecJ [Alicyclobacillus sp.]MCL6516520.1 single-stranded-DNA-specific exonuclease RecJ [Alicyclobacillus sp.]
MTGDQQARGLWRTAAVDDQAALQLAESCGVPPRVARWLLARGIGSDAVARWWDPRSVSWSDPFAFDDMGRAIDTVLAAAREGRVVALVGDYDVDGVTASAIAAEAMALAGIVCRVILPHRVRDGYGLSPNLVERAAGMGCAAIVTVDNGVRAHDAVDRAAALGMPVVVTDHHEPGDELPEAAAVVHWARASGEGLGALSGAGVAWKFALALCDRAGIRVPEETADWWLGLAALGALADVVPVTGENRRLLVEGVDRLRRARRPGWRALCAEVGLHADRVTGDLLQWTVIPRLNAAGRMDTAQLAYQLLTAPDALTAARLAGEVEACNDLRKRETDRAFAQACADIDARWADGLPSGGVAVWGPWPVGVAGIVAARLADRYNRPAVVLADDGGEVLRGSGRAPEGVHLYGMVEACAAWTDHFGGHAGAIGLGVHRSALDAFRAAFAALECPRPAEAAVIADDYLPLDDANLETLEWVERFAPFGPGNPPFLFFIGPVMVVQVTALGDGRHLRLRVREGRHEAELVWFRAPDEAHGWQPGDVIGAVCRLDRNEWQGMVRPQLRVTTGRRLHRPLMREDFGAVYRLLRARRRLMDEDLHRLGPRWTAADARLMLDTFVELGFAHHRESAYHVVDHADAKDLRESLHYQSHLRQAGRRREA